MSTKKKSVLSRAVDTIVKVSEQLDTLNSNLLKIGVELSKINEHIEATNATLGKIVEEQKISSKLANEQLRVLEITAPKG